MNLQIGDMLLITEEFQQDNALYNYNTQSVWPLGSVAVIIAIDATEVRIKNLEEISVSTTYEIAYEMRQAYLEKS